MNQIDNFIYSKEGAQQKLLSYFHELLIREIGLTAKMRYKIPFYYNRSWICYLNPLKNDGVDFAFIRGNELSNSHGLLEDRERKQVRSVAFYSMNNIPMDALLETIQEAILLDETKKYPSMRTKGS